MECSCRTAALRIFVRSIAQIHVPRPTPSRFVQAQALATRPRCLLNSQTVSPFANAPSRTLHTSCARSDEAASAPANEEDSTKSGSQEYTIESSADSTAPEPALPPNLTIVQSNSATVSSSTTPAEKGSEDGTNKPKKKKSKSGKEKEKGQEAVAKDKDDDAKKPRRKKEPWMIQKEALKKKFPEGWNPRKKLSPDALVGIKALHKQFPEEYTTEVLAEKFEVSPEAIRRILKSKWTPTPEEEFERQERWFKRGKKVWSHWAELGKKPPRKWRAEGIVRDPYWNRPRGPTHKDKAARAEAQRRLAKNMLG
ncbi:hypothetical protein VTK26DRAFT_370 [Humicola hyalothermophila]